MIWAFFGFTEFESLDLVSDDLPGFPPGVVVMSVGIVLNDWICEWLKRFLVREIAGGFGFDFVLRGYADALEVCVKVVGVEEA